MRTGFRLARPTEEDAEVDVEFFGHARRPYLGAVFIRTLQPCSDLAAGSVLEIGGEMVGEFVPARLLLFELFLVWCNAAMQRLLVGVFGAEK
jgi:hypothetical protein